MRAKYLFLGRQKVCIYKKIWYLQIENFCKLIFIPRYQLTPDTEGAERVLECYYDIVTLENEVKTKVRSSGFTLHVSSEKNKTQWRIQWFCLSLEKRWAFTSIRRPSSPSIFIICVSGLISVILKLLPS